MTVDDNLSMMFMMYATSGLVTGIRHAPPFTTMLPNAGAPSMRQQSAGLRAIGNESQWSMRHKQRKFFDAQIQL